MKHKRVDVLIALVAFVQLTALGAGGTVFSEAFNEQRNVGFLICSIVIFQISALVGVLLYINLFKVTKTKQR